MYELPFPVIDFYEVPVAFIARVRTTIPTIPAAIKIILEITVSVSRIIDRCAQAIGEKCVVVVYWHGTSGRTETSVWMRGSRVVDVGYPYSAVQYVFAVGASKQDASIFTEASSSEFTW